MTDVYPHLIPLPGLGRKTLEEITPLFGSKAETVEIAIEWGIAKAVPYDPSFPSTPQIHVHLSKDYKSHYRIGHLGAMVASALAYFRVSSEGKLEIPKGGWYGGFDLPDETVRVIRARAFAEGKHPDRVFRERYREALLVVREMVPAPGTERVDVLTDRETRDLYRTIDDEANAAGMDVDTLIAYAMFAAERRRA